jgi:hypothetical protein
MNISLIDPSIVTDDTVIPLSDATFPMWDLLYAHQIGMPTESRKPDKTGSGRNRKGPKREESERRTSRND